MQRCNPLFAVKTPVVMCPAVFITRILIFAVFFFHCENVSQLMHTKQMNGDALCR